MKRYIVAGVAIILGVMGLMSSIAAVAENTDVHYLTNMYDGSTVNTGLDNGFTGTSPINSKDVHYGWALGQFKLTGFTEVVKEDSIDVFLVNPGDKISLAYELKQNIDALNGNEGLFISEDVDGYDEAFQIERTNFGRGALLVKFTDPSNKTRVTPYKDYLTAVQGKKANATISDLEEGDYEVALDYEIEKPKVIGAYHYNYRTTFKFKVRNSSCMVFLRDLKTKDELANFSVAEDGFFLEKVSRYQQVTCGRQNLTDNGNGYSLTQMVKREACDKAEFKEPGIYTVTVKNTYTNESVEMVIAVGNDQKTNAYVTANCVYTPEEISEMVENGTARITDDWRIEVVNEPEVTEEPAEIPAIAPVDQPKTVEMTTETIIVVGCVAAVIICGLIVALARERKKTKRSSEKTTSTNTDGDSPIEEE